MTEQIVKRTIVGWLGKVAYENNVISSVAALIRENREHYDDFPKDDNFTFEIYFRRHTNDYEYRFDYKP